MFLYPVQGVNWNMRGQLKISDVDRCFSLERSRFRVQTPCSLSGNRSCYDCVNIYIIFQSSRLPEGYFLKMLAFILISGEAQKLRLYHARFC